MYPSMIDAYIEFPSNEVFFPAGLLQPPFFHRDWYRFHHFLEERSERPDLLPTRFTAQSFARKAMYILRRLIILPCSFHTENNSSVCAKCFIQIISIYT
ncbi:hypothetical protein BT96DRAFT_207336 [Gymnopus androsaceus JB14]|uniref:Uncharacterized protein n=1 Tax=Gymnopus androsaceus JB14 TaxID=1447944 RepID=A0A6A4I850_9AGAR|nr:hypothetical protein BT96DRAFT_207336 [Gymnopus androsaceus JB14]